MWVCVCVCTPAGLGAASQTATLRRRGCMAGQSREGAAQRIANRPSELVTQFDLCVGVGV